MHSQFENLDVLQRSREFAEPLLSSHFLDTGENTWLHAQAVADILRDIGSSDVMQASCYLVYTCEYLNKPHDVLAKYFGDELSDLALATTKLVRFQNNARNVKKSTTSAGLKSQKISTHVESVRKMLLAFSKDLRVVLLRLSSRLQTLRYFAASKKSVSVDLANESLHVFAPLANRLGIWQLKWEIEDLSFRFLDPITYKNVAGMLDQKRVERELDLQDLKRKLETDLDMENITASVQGRSKHIYSIVKKMQGKSLTFDQIYDVRALRVVVQSIADCYSTLSLVHSRYIPLSSEFDDYIAKPKINGYQSLHTVVKDENQLPIEVQIRTNEMHEHAEIGMSAHWAYKEAGTKGYQGAMANSSYDGKIAVLRQLLAWQQDLVEDTTQGILDDRIFVLTPQAAIVELPQGATSIDFAYSVHTDLGHRCRGAKLDGVMAPLNTALKNGQTVEILAIKEGGPSRDWLNPDLCYLNSHRAKSKVRAWFNSQAISETIAKGRQAIERVLQREGKTSIKLDDLAIKLGFKTSEKLFEVVGKDEFSLRSIETALRPTEKILKNEELIPVKKSSFISPNSTGDLLVVGVGSLLTQLGKCCKPAPPDLIKGFVTRGKGVSVHRIDCTNLREMTSKNGQRLIDVQWSLDSSFSQNTYPVDITVESIYKPGLTREISELLVKEKINVIEVNSQTIKSVTRLIFTVEVSNSERLFKVLGMVSNLEGVLGARRR